MKKLAMVLIALTLLVGCTSPTGTTSQNKDAVTQTDTNAVTDAQNTTQQEALKKVTVTDQLGREVTIEGDVNRIVSSYYITSSMLIAMDAKDKVVGLEMKADTREIYKKAAPEFLDLPAIGSGKTLNVEEILSLNPDVVIIPARLKSFIPQLEAVQIPVVAVDPENMDNFLGALELLGKVIGHEDKASELINYFSQTEEKVLALTKDLKDKPLVYLAGSGNPLVTCTGAMYQNDLIEAAGGINVSKELADRYWATISNEQLLAWNPEYIYAVSYADYGLDAFTTDGQYTTLPAVKDGHVKTFPSVLEPWDYPTPSAALGMLWLLNDLHPELYSEEMYLKDAQTFYKTFYDVDVTKEELGL